MSSSQNNSVLSYFPIQKRPNEISSKNFLNKRLKQENSENGQISYEHSDCENCSQKDIEINDLKKKISDLEKQNVELRNDNKQLKYMYNKSNAVNLDKDIKIDLLVKEKAQKDGKNEATIDNNVLFKNFEHSFNERELAQLRSIPNVKSRDSSFILQVLRFIYKNDLSILNLRTASSNVTNKKPITPQKKNIIENIFWERLDSLKLNVIECDLRKAKLNEFIINGISNIRKSLKRDSHAEFVDSPQNSH